MAVTARYFGPTNVFIPRATNQVIGYIRQPGKFKLLDYVQVVKSTSTDEGTGKPIAAYAVLNPDDAARVGPANTLTNDNPSIFGTNEPGVDNQWRWAPGDDAPEGNIAAAFYWQTVEMMRRAYPYSFDEQEGQSADLPVAQIYRGYATQIGMTVKTSRVITMLQRSGNWPSTNVADANVLNGGRGRWGTASGDEASPNFAAIRIAVQQATVNVVQYTNAVVLPEDLRVIISPNVALKLGSTGEIYNYVKSSRFSEERQQGRNQLNEQYGMPRYYAGVEWIVEDAVQVTEYQHGGTDMAATPPFALATTNRTWVKDDLSAIIVSRKGGLDGVYGAPSFSTVQIFYYKYEMAVEEMTDYWNKKHRGRVVDQFAEVLAAQRAGYLITNIL